jgi:ferredoxin
VSTNLLAMFISFGVVIALVATLGLFSLLVGFLSGFMKPPRIQFLKSEKGESGFAFGFKWNEIKDPQNLNQFRIRIYNSKGNPTQLDFWTLFSPHSSHFTEDLDLGPNFKEFKNQIKKLSQNQKADYDIDPKALVEIELTQSEGGRSFIIHQTFADFMTKLSQQNLSIKDYQEKNFSASSTTSTKTLSTNNNIKVKPDLVFTGVKREQIADTVPGKGAILKLATNPLFAQTIGSIAPAGGHQGGAAGAGAATASASEKVNFSVEKVWIAPGCIVCNACEDIYPEVFHVTSDTCIIHPNAPLNDGLRIQDASDACPVEVIKFTKAV